jgi:hypothetical protein
MVGQSAHDDLKDGLDDATIVEDQVDDDEPIVPSGFHTLESAWPETCDYDDNGEDDEGDA